MRHSHSIATASLSALLVAGLALPAQAQMRTSAPGGAAGGLGTTGATLNQPTRVFSVERAQTLTPDVSVLSIGANGVNATGVSWEYGLSDNAEVLLNGNLNLTGIGGTFGAGFGLGAAGKYRFVNTDNLGVAVAGGLQLSKTAGAAAITPAIGIDLPLSFWIGSNAAIHAMPGFQYASNADGTATSAFGTGLGYEVELNPTYRLMLEDSITFGSPVTNLYQAGVRVTMSPTTTVDVGILNGQLAMGGTPSVSGAANVTLFTLTAYFGGHTPTVRRALGL